MCVWLKFQPPAAPPAPQAPRGGASFSATCLNCLNILCGVGMLSTPYALAASGSAALVMLPLLGLAACYTGNLIGGCLAAAPGAATYPDIGGLALGRPGRLLVSVGGASRRVAAPARRRPDSRGRGLPAAWPRSVAELATATLEPPPPPPPYHHHHHHHHHACRHHHPPQVLLYLELFACCVDFLILDGDNLAALLPGAGVQALGLRLTAKQAMMVAAAGAVLPTVLLRDMSALSIVSVRPLLLLLPPLLLPPLQPLHPLV